MAKLFPHLPFVDHETPMSWAGRLAAFHTHGPVLPFLNDLSIPMKDLAGGVHGAVERLCDMANQDPEPVLRNAMRRRGDRRIDLRGEKVSAEFLTGLVTRFCPLCLLDDEKEHERPQVTHRHRWTWMLQPVRTCPLHELALVERREGVWTDFAHELAVIVPEVGAQLLQISKAQEVREPSPLQGYAVERLEGQGGPSWLDQQSLEQAVRATEVLGAVIAFGSDAKASDVTSDGWDAAGRVAWPFVCRGETGVRDALGLIGGASPSAKGGKPLRVRDFGMLYAWLSAPKLTKDPGPIRDVLRDHLVNTTDVMAGTKVLGKDITEPRLSSITSLARSEKVHHLTLRKVLISRKLIPADAEERSCSMTLVNYKVGRDLAAAMNRAVAFTALPEALNASRPMCGSACNFDPCIGVIGVQK
ncbi:TniQ family protein [Pararhodobacter oceanensis]|nr:TniQ family protein [Pararhodobacter oceanensis]